MIACNTLETFHIPVFEVTPDATRKSHWTNFAIYTTEVRVMVTYIVFELLFIAPGYQIYINYLMNVDG